jgi:hypothetical protein
MNWTLDNLTPEEKERMKRGLGPHGQFFQIILPRLIEEPRYGFRVAETAPAKMKGPVTTPSVNSEKIPWETYLFHPQRRFAPK